MLDTNIVSDLIRNPAGRAARRARTESASICLSIVVAAELRYGCAKSGSLPLLRRVAAILAELPVQSFDTPADEAYGAIQADLETRGLPIGANDLLIAAHALSMDATLVTADLAEFRRVPGLRVENWMA